MKKISARIISAILIIAVVFSISLCFSSCGTADSGKTADSTKKDETTAAETDPSEAKKKVYTRGTVENGIFSSAFLGFTFQIPSTMKVITDDEIANYLGIAAEFYSNEDFATLPEGTQYELFTTAQSGDNIQFTLVKKAGEFILDEINSSAIAAVKTLYEGSSLSGEWSEPVNFTFMGNTYQKVKAKITVNSRDLYQYMYAAKYDNYYFTISYTTFSGMTDTQFEALFTQIN